MCGINGILALSETAGPISQPELRRTRDAMSARGPDADGEWIAPDMRIGLGHRRLAIIDLSAAAEQPMTWADDRYRIVFNGEIYNFLELKADLERKGVVFHTHSDTEVLLALYALNGPDMLNRLRGMFALAIWDMQTGGLLLARDPFGIKPLYYSYDGVYLRFASQVKALEAGGAVSLAPSPAAIAGFLLWGSIPEPHTIRQAIHALPAGSFLLVEDGRLGAVRHYYPPTDATRTPMCASDAIRDSVQAHLAADVPMAVFLSAGLDSALVAASASATSNARLTSITVRFRSFLDTPWDEGPLAREVASHLGTQHIERIVDVSDFPDLWPRVLDAMDQPSVDGFNTYIISRIAHELGFKVVLSGLGGDETFGGYGSFQEVPKWTARTRLLRTVPLLAKLWPQLARTLRPQQPKLAGLLKYGSGLPGVYYLWRGLFLPEELPRLVDPDIAAAGLAAYEPVAEATRQLDRAQQENAGSFTDWHKIQALESRQYMRNQLLRDADWAGMAHSLELRVPLVDVSLSAHMIANDFEPARSRGKAAVVRAIAPHLPAELWQRPKSGFFIPVTDWLDSTRAPGKARSWGHDSRQVALKVLREFVPGVVN